MANEQSGNTWFVDSSGSLSVTGSLRVHQVVISPSTHGSGSPLAILQDMNQVKANKIVVATPNTQTTSIPFPKPLEFLGGIYVSTISAAYVTVVYEKVGG